jgi:truncated hemoglobin YjbI
MTERIIELFNDSLERCRQAPGFLDAFYDRLMRAAPEIPALFRDTDFLRQKRMLTMSFYLLLGAAQGYTEGVTHIQRLAEVHAARGIPRALYDVWLECLIQTVSELDPRYTRGIGDAWREFLMPAVEAMRAAAPA